MSNQIAIAANMVGVSEAMAYALRAGLDAMKVIACIESGAAGSVILSGAAPSFLKGNFAPGFFVTHFIKDLGSAIDSADKVGLALPGLDLAKELYDQLAASGGEDYGVQALFKLYEK
jgi:3-hydroxyisobutyrate dehydrogenase